MLKFYTSEVRTTLHNLIQSKAFIKLPLRIRMRLRKQMNLNKKTAASILLGSDSIKPTSSLYDDLIERLKADERNYLKNLYDDLNKADIVVLQVTTNNLSSLCSYTLKTIDDNFYGSTNTKKSKSFLERILPNMV